MFEQMIMLAIMLSNKTRSEEEALVYQRLMESINLHLIAANAIMRKEIERENNPHGFEMPNG